MGVGTKGDKTGENSEIAASFFARYPNDRLLPLPTKTHPYWPPERVGVGAICWSVSWWPPMTSALRTYGA